MSKVVVVGLGYVGLPVALLTSEKGHNVTGIDLDVPKLEKIRDKKDPIGEDFIAERISNTKFTVTDNFDSIKDADVVVVCVPTPVNEDFSPNLGPVKGACTSIAQKMSKGTLVILESTINPGVCDEVVIPLMEEVSGMKCGEDFYVSHCPERINPGDPKWNVSNIPRVVGSVNAEGLRLTVEFYKSFLDSDIKEMGSLKEAEAVKIVENTFRDVNIAFVNELAMSFTKLGINVVNVIDGAATKPFAFMPHYPGAGVGGHCIPVDPYYLIEYAKDNGFDHKFLSLAREINNGMPQFVVDQLIDGLNEVGLPLKGTKVAVLGLSYKANVADDRQSPSYEIIRILEEKGALVKTFDPHYSNKSSANSLNDSLTNTDAVIIATSHKEFLDHHWAENDVKVLVDGRNNSLNIDPKVIYKGIGTA